MVRYGGRWEFMDAVFGWTTNLLFSWKKLSVIDTYFVLNTQLYLVTTKTLQVNRYSKNSENTVFIL